MAEYIVKIGFWLRGYDSLTVNADSDAEAIEKAKTAALAAMEAGDNPEHIDTDERREGLIVYIDHLTGDDRREVITNVEFDDDRIRPAV